MRVLVHSPVRLFGEGVAAFVRTIEFVDAARAENEAVALEDAISQLPADVVLLDVTAPSSLTQARALRQCCPGVDIVAMAVPDMAEAVIACADAGVVAYIPRDATTTELALVLSHTRRGETHCDPSITRSLFRELANRQATSISDELSPLTRREIETARLVSQGLSNKEIAQELHVSVATIKNHVHSVLHKLGVSRRSQVAGQLAQEPWTIPPRHYLRELSGR